jgi:hypothetical protein
VNSNPEFQNEEERILKTYEVKSEDGLLYKYDVYFINEPTKRTRPLPQAPTASPSSSETPKPTRSGSSPKATAK